MTQDRQNSTTFQRMRRIGWVAGLVLILALAISGLKPGLGALRQAMGIRSLLQAGGGFADKEVLIPFVCLRLGGDASIVNSALKNLSDEYLRGVALCMAGDYETGLEILKGAGGHSNAEVQYAGGVSVEEAQEGAQMLAEGEFTEDELVEVVRKMINIPSIDPYPALRLLAHQANAQPETWIAWLEGSSRWEASKDWQKALEWLEEGLASAPKEVQGSLYLREGRIWQTRAEGRDYRTAVESYNKAIEGGGWISKSDEANAHLYRGELYRSLKEEYSPEQALAEFQQALELVPGKYSALLDMGHVYMYDMKDLDKAESYYRQALASDEQSPTAYLYIGDVYKARGEIEAAGEWYRKALERRPDWQMAIDRLKSLEDQ